MVSHLRVSSDRMAKDAFISIDQAAEFAEGLDQDPNVTNIYINLQQLKAGSATDKRQDVARYVRFLVDIDRRDKRVDGVRVNASEEDRIALFNVAREVGQWVSGILGAHPLVADSGNGFHLCWSLRPDAFTESIAASHENQMVYGECLKAIGQRFDNELVKIDTSLSEPEQIIRLWGTWNRRDPETEGRPHRQSRILEKARGTVSLAQLGMLELEYRAPAKEHDKSKGDIPPLHPNFDEEAWWEHYSPIFVQDGERVGWKITSICLLTYMGEEFPGWKHTGSKVTGVRFDRGQPEANCFSDEDLNGRPHTDYTFAQTMDHVHQYFPKYPGVIWDWSEKDAQLLDEFQVESADAIPESTPAKPNGHDESYNLKGTPCPKCQKELVAGAQDTECQTCIAKARTAVEEGRSELLLVKDKGGNTVQVVSINAASVRPEELTWTWKNRIPDASITWFVGKPGQGKSLAAVNVAATVSTGRDWADGAKNTMGPNSPWWNC